MVVAGTTDAAGLSGVAAVLLAAGGFGGRGRVRRVGVRPASPSAKIWLR